MLVLLEQKPQKGLSPLIARMLWLAGGTERAQGLRVVESPSSKFLVLRMEADIVSNKCISVSGRKTSLCQ